MNEFKPEEGDRILAADRPQLFYEHIFLYISNDGRYMCVYLGDEEIYNNGCGGFRVMPWRLAKPLPPKLPEFIERDPIIVWRTRGGVKFLRVVEKMLESGSVKCFGDGAISKIMGNCTWENYKPLPNYNYGDRKVWGSEDNK
jgi:hypothetical protein